MRSVTARGGFGTLATSLRIQPVEGRRALKQFLQVPARLHAGDSNWVQPLLFERLEHLNPKKNPYFEHAEVAYWLALRGERPVGRISAQVDRLHLERHGDATANQARPNRQAEVGEGWWHATQVLCWTREQQRVQALARCTRLHLRIEEIRQRTLDRASR
jgi:hypothetical protein